MWIEYRASDKKIKKSFQHQPVLFDAESQNVDRLIDYVSIMGMRAV